MNLRKWAVVAAALPALTAGWCLWLWQPVRQVRLHQEHFLQAYEHRDWVEVRRFLDAHYADRWGHDKEFVIRSSKEVFGQFLMVGIESETIECSATDGSGRIVSRVKMRGQGSPVAQLVVERVNALHDPFICDWVHRGWKPWEWTLVKADQPELNLEIPDF